MGFCANCGQPRKGNLRFCGSCGTEFDDSAAPDQQAAPATQASGWAAPADSTRTDLPPRDTRIDPPEASAGQPDPFASWYSSAQPAAAPEPPRGEPGTFWQQPTEMVYPSQQGPGGYGASPAPGGYPTAAFGAPYQPGPQAGPPRRGGGKTGLLVVLAIIVVLAAGGGAYAVATKLGKHSTASPSAPPSSGTAASSPSTATQPAAGAGSASATASASAKSSGSATSPSLVSVGPGVSGAAVPQAQQLLSTRFQAINTHNYAEYASTLTTRAQAIQTQASFDKGYRSSSDSGITLTALSQTASGLTATVAFTSHQNPSDSVDGSACNTWTTTYYLVPSGSGYLIDSAPAGSPPPVHGDC